MSLQTNAEKSVVPLTEILRRMTGQIRKFSPAFSTTPAVHGNPYRVLISCLISLRTKDTVTAGAAGRVFETADTPERMRDMDRITLERLLYPAGFYRNKTRILRAVSKELCTRFDGVVPSQMEELLSLPGVGRKTANLVRAEGFDIPAVCVDTHVHRICNRLGAVSTRKPEETESALRKLLPRRRWSDVNRICVPFGQHVCVPLSPFCGGCRVRQWCQQRGVNRWRQMQ
ncbi:MAG: endonuclease III [Candidatus Omnitrophica bacterium]|nr:endonuclease III [Candidatus Omnitrophota bacterium]